MRIIIALLVALIMTGCTKWMDTAPSDQIGTDNAFSDDATATAVALSIYNTFSVSFPTDELTTLYVGHYTDELTAYQPNATIRGYSASVVPATDNTLFNLWRGVYSGIYQCNSLLEQLPGSAVSDTTKARLEGEARFFRAFGYSHLGGLFGGLPLVTSSDVRKTSVASRVPIADVYRQASNDLEVAVTLLRPYDGTEKVRVTREAALSLLARIYLFTGDWQRAEQASAAVLATGHYTPLPAPVAAFVKNSPEIIFSFWKQNGFTSLAASLVPSSGRPTHQVSPQLRVSFDTADLRYKHWIGRQVVGVDTLLYVAKYKRRSASSTLETEYTVVLRAGEQLLILTEALTRQGKTTEAAAALNPLRTRAGLQELPAESSQEQLLDAVWAERRRELFMEWGLRLPDLRRSGRINEVMGFKPTWKSWAQWYPVPAAEIKNNPNLIQNDGYAQ